MYLTARACPQYEPTDSEMSDFRLQVMTHIHAIYQRKETERLGAVIANRFAEAMGGSHG